MNYFLIVLGLISCWTVKASTISFPEVYDVLKVDGVEYKQSFFSSEAIITLGKGRHEIVYRYNELIEDADNDDHTKIVSLPYVLVLNNVETSLTVKAPSFSNLSQARSYAKHPKLSITSVHGLYQTFQLTSLADYSQSQASIEKHTANLNTDKNRKNIMNSALIVNKSNNDEQVKTSRALDMLNYWWQQASEADRQAFLKQQNINR